MVVFDEFPLTSLLDEHYQIDSVRYPHFAALAEQSTWFRNATTVSGDTVVAVPSLLTGQYPDGFVCPAHLIIPPTSSPFSAERTHLK